MSLEYRRVVGTKYDQDSFITALPDTNGDTSSFGAIEAYHPYGFAGRPDDLDANGACNAFFETDERKCYSIFLNDGRAQALLPEVLPGESFQYGAFGNFVRCHRDGRVSLFTSDDGTVNGRTIALTLGPQFMTFNAPWGNFRFDATGFHLLHISGARIDLGACGGLPAPLSALAAYAKISAPLVHIEGSAVNIGSATGIAAPVAKGDLVVITLAEISAALVAIGAALTATESIPGANAIMAGPVSAAQVAISAAVAAIAAQSPLIPSYSTMVT